MSEIIFSSKRVRQSTIQRNDELEDFYSDRSRIIYCSSFRRLMQKAQVFSLEPNASVRTRLTHSLEVADLGRTLALKIANNMIKSEKMTFEESQKMVAIVENACLLHDIGNPPFGHFGEAAIKDWAKRLNHSIIPNEVDTKNELFKLLVCDFKEFDGNPQGFRTVTKLHFEKDEFSLNLTYSTLLSILKYSRAAGEKKGTGIMKKAGYFQSERALVETIHNDSGITLHHRYPLTYIMEAADDIAYCMSDISDGIEKGIITTLGFLDSFKKEWKKHYSDPIPVKTDYTEDDEVSFSLDISVPWSRKAMEYAAESFMDHYEEVIIGTKDCLIDEESPIGCVLETMKRVSRTILYTSIEAESIELTGYAVITGILKWYKRLLSMKYEDFISIVQGNAKGFDLERRLFNRLGKRYVRTYSKELEKIDSKADEYLIQEWWLRAHLIIDHISGMTDEFALQTYQMLEGINLLPM